MEEPTVADLRGQYGGGEMRQPRPEETGVGDWCAPGPADEQKQKWLLMFEDRDMVFSVFEDEQEALDAFARAECGGWNCHLFALVRRVTPNAIDNRPNPDD
jgi:hypothetical protein